jgi:hypothetical protein
MTIRQGIYTTFFSVITLLGPGDLLGQESDFQSWWEFEFDYSLSNSWQLEGELEQRFKNNSLQYNRTLLTLGAEYDPWNWLRLGGAGRVVFVADREGQIHPRYRIHFDATGRYDLSSFTFSLRTRLQYGFEDILMFADLRENSLVIRNRLKVRYHFFGTKFRCFAALESWHNLSELPDPAFIHMRYQAGLSYDLNFKSRFTLRYIFEDEFNVQNPDKLHILVAGYRHSF